VTVLELLWSPIRLLRRWLIGGYSERRDWQTAAARLRMGFTPGIRYHISGSRQGFQVSIEPAGNDLTVVVSGDGRIPAELELGPETALSRTLASDIATGDGTFDYYTRVTGSETIAVALLGSRTRALVYDAVQRGVTVKNSSISHRAASLDKLPGVVDQMVDLATRLALEPHDIPARLADNALHDPLSEAIRLRNLELLLERYGDHEAAARTARTALQLGDRSLRLAAAVFLGNEGIAAVCELARSEPHTDHIRLAAIEHLTRASWAEKAIPVLVELLESEAELVRRAAVVGLGKFRHAAAAPELRAMIRDQGALTIKAIAEALGRIGDRAAEPDMILLLRDADPEVVEAAARALGRIGSAAAVEPLLPLIEHVQPPPLRRAAREAIDRIQARLAGAEHGQLSVAAAEDHEGALSRADKEQEGGELSLEGGARIGSEAPEAGGRG
jgi:hypothetical protein